MILSHQIQTLKLFQTTNVHYRTLFRRTYNTTRRLQDKTSHTITFQILIHSNNSRTVQQIKRTKLSYRHWYRHTPRHNPKVQCAFKISMTHWILQFALRIAVRSVLHRCASLDIHCWKLLSSFFFILLCINQFPSLHYNFSHWYQSKKKGVSKWKGCTK